MGLSAFILPGILYLILGLMYVETTMVNSYKMYKNFGRKGEKKVLELSLISLISFVGTFIIILYW